MLDGERHQSLVTLLDTTFGPGKTPRGDRLSRSHVQEIVAAILEMRSETVILLCDWLEAKVRRLHQDRVAEISVSLVARGFLALKDYDFDLACRIISFVAFLGWDERFIFEAMQFLALQQTAMGFVGYDNPLVAAHTGDRLATCQLKLRRTFLVASVFYEGKSRKPVDAAFLANAKAAKRDADSAKPSKKIDSHADATKPRKSARALC